MRAVARRVRASLLLATVDKVPAAYRKGFDDEKMAERKAEVKAEEAAEKKAAKKSTKTAKKVVKKAGLVSV